jgi:hypothetical protein
MNHNEKGGDKSVSDTTVHAVEDRVDLGNRLFIAGFFVSLALVALVTLAGFTQTRSIWVALLGAATLILLPFLASRLYTGNPLLEWVVRILPLALLLLAVVALVRGRGGPVAIYLAIQLLLPGLFALAVVSGPVRDLLRTQRGETVAFRPRAAATQEESLLAPGETLREEARQPIRTYVLVLRIISGLLGVSALATLAFAVWSLVAEGSGLFLLIVGLLAVFPAFVLFNLADNWYFLASTTGYGKVHAGNVIRDTQVISICATVALVVLGLLTILDLVLS